MSPFADARPRQPSAWAAGAESAGAPGAGLAVDPGAGVSAARAVGTPNREDRAPNGQVFQDVSLASRLSDQGVSSADGSSRLLIQLREISPRTTAPPPAVALSTIRRCIRPTP